MLLKTLKIGNLSIQVPIIQGGMGVGKAGRKALSPGGGDLAGPQPQVPLVYRQQLRGWVYPVLLPVHGPGKVFQGH